MAPRLSERSHTRLPAAQQAAFVFVTVAVLAACALLWTVFAAPARTEPFVAVYGGTTGLLLSAALAAATYHAAAARAFREHGSWLDARVAALEAEIRAFEEEARYLADEVLPAIGERGAPETPAETRLSGTGRVSNEALAHLRDGMAREVRKAERRGSSAMSACASAAARVQAQVTTMLAQLRSLEDRYGDQPSVFGDLLELDHRAAQTGRLADSFALLSGGRSGRRWTRPVAMESILRGAVSRIWAYRRVRLNFTSTAAVAGHAAEGVMHALAEVMDNATSFSATNTEVHVFVEEVDHGVAIVVEDSGLGMRSRERQRAEQLVSESRALTTLPGTRLGLAVVGRIADKYGLTVNFRPSSRGGTGVVLLVPRRLITHPKPLVDELTTPSEPAAKEPRTVHGSADGGSRRVPEAPRTAPQEDGNRENETRQQQDGDLPKRRRGSTLASAPRPTSAPNAHVPRERTDPATRFAAFRQSGRTGPGAGNQEAEDR
ncbi:signal transduction histidine kinase [Haloactinospora alba]|uniref:histidine kinase n=1 Tax=Haloactinospora alba TaxID=405555 RepID=A0A543NJN5_9ACTN|nr:ATP-binding protein [Haloactinospora alba]TQN32085.1 signal transduction histidine kinase [Haloactinospora alba]